jgi:hypothetical protein
MIWFIVALIAASFVARHGIAAGLFALALLPFVIPFAIIGFFVLAGTIIAIGG